MVDNHIIAVHSYREKNKQKANTKQNNLLSPPAPAATSAMMTMFGP